MAHEQSLSQLEHHFIKNFKKLINEKPCPICRRLVLIPISQHPSALPLVKVQSALISRKRIIFKFNLAVFQPSNLYSFFSFLEIKDLTIFSSLEELNKKRLIFIDLHNHVVVSVWNYVSCLKQKRLSYFQKGARAISEVFNVIFIVCMFELYHHVFLAHSHFLFWNQKIVNWNAFSVCWPSAQKCISVTFFSEAVFKSTGTNFKLGPRLDKSAIKNSENQSRS